MDPSTLYNATKAYSICQKLGLQDSDFKLYDTELIIKLKKLLICYPYTTTKASNHVCNGVRIHVCNGCTAYRVERKCDKCGNYESDDFYVCESCDDYFCEQEYNCREKYECRKCWNKYCEECWWANKVNCPDCLGDEENKTCEKCDDICFNCVSLME